MYLLFISPARHIGRLNPKCKGELHVTKNPEMPEALKSDGLNPLDDECKYVMIKTDADEKVIGNIVAMFFQNNWWTCWCDNPHEEHNKCGN